jgi:hypothetical protein
VEQFILFIALMLGLALMNYIARRLGRPSAPQPEPEPPERRTIPPPSPPRPPAIPPPPPAPPARPATGAPRPAVVAHPGRIRRLRLRTPAEVREAMVLMTVLGPCRALESDERAGGPFEPSRPAR